MPLSVDMSSFNDDHFDAKEWINQTFKNLNQNEDKEVCTSSLLTKLQTHMQQISIGLEETRGLVLHTLPRIMHDAKVLKNESLILKEKMITMKHDLLAVEENAGKSVADIERLDKIKTKLELAKQGLLEADNWTILANELEDVFESGDIQKISGKIVSMQQSLHILKSSSDFEERKLQLEGLKNRLEAMISPLLVQAFTSGNIDQSCIYVTIFKDIERLPQLLKYYHNSQKGILIQRWRSLLEVEQDETFPHCLHNYYDSLISNWHSQLKWCCVVFPSSNSVVILIDLYTDLLVNMDPSINECIDAALKQQSDQLALLLELKQTTKQFANNIIALIESTEQGKMCSSQQLTLLYQSIYSIYIPYFNQYSEYEEAYLMQRFNEMNCIKTDITDTIQSLGMSVSRIFDITAEANKRCQQLTEGCCYSRLIVALKSFFTKYIDSFKIALRQIDRAKKADEDWNMFQICLTLLQNAGQVLNHLNSFEKELALSIKELPKVSEYVDVSYSDLFLDDKGQWDFKMLIEKSNSSSLLEVVKQMCQKLCSDIHHVTYQVIFTPISTHLQTVKHAPGWNQSAKSQMQQSDLPDYSFSPQEYITQIGQYLMTLPQHLEPFLLQQNSSLTLALKASDQEYKTSDTSEDDDLADILLGIIARGTCQMYADNILTICELNGSANKQLLTDIEYLGNVLEDLGLSLSEPLQQICILLRLSPEEYQTGSAGSSARLVAAVRQMRNITSSS